MKYLKTLLFFVLGIACMPVNAQADFYTAPHSESKGSRYLFYKPDSGFADILKYDKGIAAGSIAPVIENYGERAVLLDADSFTIETDRTTALYFKAKNGKREIYLKKFLNQEKCWDKGAIAYASVDLRDKNTVTVYLANSKGETFALSGAEVQCGGAVVTLNIETEYATATGMRPPSDVQKAAAGISVVQENKVLIIKVPRESLVKFVSLNFRLYSGKKEVKEFLNIKSTENILYINDLPKGKYKYSVEVYDGTFITEGTITLKK